MEHYPAPLVRWPYKKLRWALFRILDIMDAEDPQSVYLRRFIIFKTPLCALYIHFIYRPDGGRHPHNHPFNFRSWVVRGSYDERIIAEKNGPEFFPRTRRRWTVARTTMSDFHLIDRVDPAQFTGILSAPRAGTVTVVATGRIAQSWGFLTDGGYVDNRTYLGLDPK